MLKPTAVKILTILLLTACSGTAPRAPVASLEQPPSQKISSHTVARGETLYSIAWRYQLNVRALARSNGISEPYTIYPGQKLSLSLERRSTATSRARPAKTQSDTRERQRSKIRSAPPPAPKPAARQSSELRWRWPVDGTIIAGFSGAKALNKGIDIKAENGEPVSAVEAGTVVYAGNGLRGYGNLLIIKHNENYLSAYAHNSKLLVAEGERVKAGQQIAEVGSSGTDTAKLHFEIRRDGKPVDPLRYLPRR